MLVKIIALGLSPAIWKNVFHHLRNALPNHPFAAGIFTTPEEVAYLAGEILPENGRREAVDFMLCEFAPGGEWKQTLPFLRRLNGRNLLPPVELVLTLSTLEQGIKQLIQSQGAVSLLVDRKLMFSLSDPEFIIRQFPANFPRIRVDGHIDALRLRSRNGIFPAGLKAPPKAVGDITGGGKTREIRPAALPHSAMVGFSEIEAIIKGGEAVAPQDWLREVLRTEQTKLPRGGCPGLVREPKGVYLCPGLPLERITGVVIDGTAFNHLLDLGQLNEHSKPFAALWEAIRESGTRHQQRWREATRQLRIAESKADMPLVIGGGLPLVRETLAMLLNGRGFRRCIAVETTTEGMFREPVLVMRAGPWPAGEMSVQVEDPIVVSLEEELEQLMLPIDALLDWREFSYQAVATPEIPLTPQSFAEKREALETRGRKANDGVTLAENRALLLNQERQVLELAMDKLAGLLEAEESLQVWEGRLPDTVRQVVVFSHDHEEAGAVLQALPGIARKRWFDLSPYTEPEALPTLSLEPLKEYLEHGVMVITSASRERLNTLRIRVREDIDVAERGLGECRSAVNFYQQERGKIAIATEELARQWVNDAIDDWLERNMEALWGQVDTLRRRHERRWFARALVHRVVIVPSGEDNGNALLAACRNVYPSFNLELSAVVSTLPPQSLPLGRERGGGAVDSTGDTTGDSGSASPSQDRVGGVDSGQLEAYLQAACMVLGGVKADLLIIEQARETAFAVLERLRAELPQLAEIPAIVILPDYWTPRENQPMPWSRTRVIILPRLGGLSAEEFTRQLESVHLS